MFPVDLHLHTTASDGHWSPSELVSQALEAGLEVMAVTDHDTVAGIAEAVEAARGKPIEVVAGVEISATCNGQAVHLLGYFFDPGDDALQEYLHNMEEARVTRAHRIVERLQALDIDITFDKVQAHANGASIGRPHIAAALVESGAVDTEQQAFDEYLKNDGAAYVAKPKRPASHAIDLLHRAGGISVLAHPGHWTRLVTIEEMTQAGLDGIEVRHPAHDRGLTRYYGRKANDFGLIPSGGSDAHGRDDEETAPGKFGLKLEEYEALRLAALV